MNIFFIGLMMVSCAGDDPTPVNQNPPPATPHQYKYLALGDSYTIGESVCSTCSFPQQLKSQLQSTLSNTTIDLQVIATTGWTTTNLKAAITSAAPTADYDLVTLLIGVNNQYQHKPFSVYQQEFPELVNTAIALAKGDRSNVVVVSIPDYRYTPFGNGLSNPDAVSQEIAQYNSFAANYCDANNITFVNITDITQMGHDNPALVASDGLHPSELAYSKFVERILPKAVAVLSTQ